MTRRLNKSVVTAVLLAMWLSLAGASSVWAAGSCVFTMVGAMESFSELTWVCTSDASGDVSAPTVTGTNAAARFNGRIDRVQIVPGTAGDAPDGGYSVQLYANGDTTVDRLYAMGAAPSTTNTTIDSPLTTTNGYVVRLFNDTLVPGAAGVGNANKFTLKVLLDNRR